jgi:hypothetical protein
LGSNPEVRREAPRDVAADAIAETVCERAESCCLALGYGSPGESCRSSVRNTMMEQIILAEDDGREVVLDEVLPCLDAFDAAFDDPTTCPSLPSPADVLELCPALFTRIPEGDRLPGEPCGGAHDCASPTEAGSRACVDQGAGGSICFWFLDRPLGAACDAETGKVVTCSGGLTCAPTVRGELFCSQPLGYDAPCLSTTDTSCQEGLTCQTTEMGLRCRAMPPDLPGQPDVVTPTPLELVCR